jgi:hypothetical protein
MRACLAPAGPVHHRNRIMSVDATPETAEPPSGPLAPARPAKPCANCGAPMYGPFCYACGQPEKGMIRHLASVMADVADTIFNVDSRIFRSVPALYFRPGFLTNEYFAGRRTRYVTPFRLFFFLSVIAFFAIQFASMPELGGLDDGVSLDGIVTAQTPEELDERTQKFVAELEEAQKAASISPKAAAKIGRNIDAAKQKSQERRTYLLERAKAIAEGKPTPPDTSPSTDSSKSRAFRGSRRTTTRASPGCPISSARRSFRPRNVSWKTCRRCAAIPRISSRVFSRCCRRRCSC